MANAWTYTTHENDTETVVLEMSKGDAEILTALLSSCVGGEGRVRDRLTYDNDSIFSVLEDTVGYCRMSNRGKTSEVLTDFSYAVLTEESRAVSMD